MHYIEEDKTDKNKHDKNSTRNDNKRNYNSKNSRGVINFNLIYEKLNHELEYIHNMFDTKFTLYEKICEANDDTQYEVTEIDSSKIAKAQYELKYKKIIAEKEQAQNKSIEKHKNNEVDQNIMKRIDEHRHNIADTVLKVNEVREQKIQEESTSENSVYKMKKLLEELNNGYEQPQMHLLDKFDKILQNPDLANCDGYANETFNAIINHLKHIEKSYEFNAIDPIDEERDHIELKHKLLKFEKSRHETNPILVQEENNLSESEKLKSKINKSKDLNEIKKIENKITKLLVANSLDSENLDDEIEINDQDTLDLSESYYKKSIIRARKRMIDKQVEYVDRMYELNSKTNDFYSDNLSKLETRIKQHCSES